MDSGVHEENSSSQNDKFYILSISRQGGAGGMCKITCTGAFFFVPRAVCEDLTLAEGELLTERQVQVLQFQHLICSAYQKAIDLISRKDHSRMMLRLKLRKRDYPDEVVAHVLQRLAEEGILDDEKFGEHYLQFLLKKNKYGRPKILAKLREKGLSRELAEALTARVSEIEEDEALWENAAKLFRRGNITKEKMARSLISRGFPPGKVYTCISEYFRF